MLLPLPQVLFVSKVLCGNRIVFDSERLHLDVRCAPFSPFTPLIPYVVVEQGYRDTVDALQPAMHAGGLRSAVRFSSRAREQQSGVSPVQDDAWVPGTLQFRLGDTISHMLP